MSEESARWKANFPGSSKAFSSLAIGMPDSVAHHHVRRHYKNLFSHKKSSLSVAGADGKRNPSVEGVNSFYDNLSHRISYQRRWAERMFIAFSCVCGCVP